MLILIITDKEERLMVQSLIQVPERFQRYLLPEVQSLIKSGITNNFSGLDVYFSEQPFYFPEYTNHGITHINNVLDFADKLIPESFYEALGKKENKENTVSILVLSILLHDLGMFIKESGLKYLLGMEENNKSNSCAEWKKRWDEFCFQICHAPSKVLDIIYGNEENYQFNISSKPFCAEFIRKNHHRIAYQIAVEGFPGETLNTMFKTIQNQDIVKLAGIVAMSHGINLRDVELENELKSLRQGTKAPYGAPVYYLMAVLRLADLIDAGIDRAPKLQYDMDSFNSLISEREWRLNERINHKKMPPDSDLAECLEVAAFPKDSVEYVQLKSWFDYWQKELDLSWAVIGEKYDTKYQLTIRRVIAPMEEEDRFVTREMALKVNPDIVKHLIAPLYGEDVSYGVRELLQNSVDACIERKIMEDEKGKDYKGEIVVDVDTANGLFTITDNGIGMTADIIANYYLTVGASFRNSPEWYQDFQDEERKPKMARNGRFGIGALAAFLIGSTVKVLTRNINENFGYSFSYSLESNLLNVEKISEVEIGTKIQIKISEKNTNKFKIASFFNRPNVTVTIKPYWMDWYRFSTPEIHYILNGTEMKLLGGVFDLEKGKDTDGWFSIIVHNFESFHFSFSRFFSLYNGFILNLSLHGLSNINKSAWFSIEELHNLGYYGVIPRVAVRDSHNQIQLNLERTQIITPISLKGAENLVREFCKYMIAELLLDKKSSFNLTVYSKKGFTYSERSYILHTKDTIYYLWYNKFEIAASTRDIINICKKSDLCICQFDTIFPGGADHFIVGETEYGTHCHFVKDDKSNIHVSSILDALSSMRRKVIKDVIIYKPKLYEGEDNLMLKALQDYLPEEKNGGWIPFDMEDRKRMYSKAFQDLDKYIKDIEQRPY